MKRTYKKLLSAACFCLVGFCTQAKGGIDLVETTILRHAALSRRAAADGMALLKNDGVLPLAAGSRVAFVQGDWQDAVVEALVNYLEYSIEKI